MIDTYLELLESHQLSAATTEIDRLYREHIYNVAVFSCWAEHMLQLREGEKVLSEVTRLQSITSEGQDMSTLLDLKRRSAFQVRNYDLAMSTLRSHIEYAKKHSIRHSPKEKKQRFIFDSDAALNYVLNLLSELRINNLRVAPQGGTLLGIVRDKKLITNDKDIDLCVELSELKPVINFFLARKFKLSLEVSNYSNFFTFWDPGEEVTIDLMGIKTFKEGAVGGYFDRGNLQKWSRLLRYPKFELESAAICGKTVYFPKFAEGFLESDYGAWQISNPDWITFLDAPNLIKQTPLNIYLIYVHLLKAIVTGDQYKSSLILDRVKKFDMYGEFALQTT